MPSLIYFLNKVDTFDNPKLLELVEMELEMNFHSNEYQFYGSFMSLNMVGWAKPYTGTVKYDLKISNPFNVLKSLAQTSPLLKTWYFNFTQAHGVDNSLKVFLNISLLSQGLVTSLS